jgi:hypothetical protein
VRARRGNKAIGRKSEEPDSRIANLLRPMAVPASTQTCKTFATQKSNASVQCTHHRFTSGNPSVRRHASSISPFFETMPARVTAADATRRHGRIVRPRPLSVKLLLNSSTRHLFAGRRLRAEPGGCGDVFCKDTQPTARFPVDVWVASDCRALPQSAHQAFTITRISPVYDDGIRLKIFRSPASVVSD